MLFSVAAVAAAYTGVLGRRYDDERLGAILLLAVAAIAVAYTGIAGRRHDDEKLKQWTDEQAIPLVALVSMQEGGKARELVLPGNVEAFDTASIHGQVSGYVQEWRKDIGAQVHQGDVLAVVDTPELDQRLAVAQSELAKAKANMALAKVTADRWNSLRASAAVSQQAADEKDSDARAKAAEVEAAQSNVDRMKALKAFANIVAPFDGVVTARNVDIGSLVKADSNDGGALYGLRHSSDADLRSRAAILCGCDEGRHEGDPRIARISRPHLQRDNRHDLARDRQEIALTAGRTPRRQQGWRAFPRRVRASPFSASARPQHGDPSCQCAAVSRQCPGVAILGLDNRIVLKKFALRATSDPRSRLPAG